MKSRPSLGEVIPAIRWIREYKPSWLRADLAAGVTLSAYLLPSALGDASLAGLSPEAGLYACLFGGLAFWLFCSAKHTAISVTSAISLLIGSSLGAISGGDPARHASLAACVALLTAAIAFAAWLIRAGSAVKFISESVMTGFKAGVALHLASTQLPKLFGVQGAHGGDFWERMAGFLHHVFRGETNFVSLGCGLVALALLILGKKILPNKPVALFVVIAGIVFASWMNLGSYGVKLLGEIPLGLPTPGLPLVELNDLRELLPLALACFLLGAVETAAIGRMFAEKHGYRLDSNQDLLGLAGANLASGLGQGFPVSGGMSQSLVNESGGARTALSGLIAALILGLVALFFAGLLKSLPQPVLAAVVLMAVASLVKVKLLRRLWTTYRGEFLVAMSALLGVLAAGLLKGVLLGAVISLVLLIRRASSPHVAFLGRIPGVQRYSDADRHTKNELTPGVLIFRVESGIVYFNSEHIFDTILARLEEETAKAPIWYVVGDLSSSPLVDMVGATMLKTLHADLERKGIALRLVEAHGSVRTVLRAEGLEEKVGPISRSDDLAAMIEECRQEAASKSSRPIAPRGDSE